MEEDELEEEEDGDGVSNDWITTFADLMSLLLTFFILMLTFSTMEANKLKKMVTAIRKSKGLTINQFSSAPQLVTDIAIVERRGDAGGGLDLKKVQEQMKSFISSQGFSANISIDTNRRGMVMRIDHSAIFPPGSVKIKKEIIPVLDKMIKIIRNKPFFMLIEGHTDDTPVQGGHYPSNWELGADRAGSVARYLISDGHMNPKRFEVISLASTDPLFPNDSEENRSKNRRVEIILARERL